jgi:hypothetical protein
VIGGLNKGRNFDGEDSSFSILGHSKTWRLLYKLNEELIEEIRKKETRGKTLSENKVSRSMEM